ncbi:MAG TPA: hypothetical protein VF094_05570 [Gaiellaceae bacterium]
MPAASPTREAGRLAAIAGTDESCPRCGARRRSDQQYCLDCGLLLPDVTGTVPALRRRWLRTFGWYPGDFVWAALLALVVAIVGAAAAIAVGRHRAAGGPPSFAAATTAAPVRAPAAEPPIRLRARVGAGKLPKAPEPGTTRPGRLTWPKDANGWTVVLVSYPKNTGRLAALAKASEAAKTGLAQVGVIDSSRFASLQPGYFVVFTGIYGSQTDADTAVPTVRAAGFAGAYSRQIAR